MRPRAVTSVLSLLLASPAVGWDPSAKMAANVRAQSVEEEIAKRYREDTPPIDTALRNFLAYCVARSTVCALGIRGGL